METQTTTPPQDKGNNRDKNSEENGVATHDATFSHEDSVNGSSLNGRSVNGDIVDNQKDSVNQLEFDPSIPERLLPKLPTFPMAVGWRTVYDEETQNSYNIPLTLRDILFPTEDDVGAVYMSHGLNHDELLTDISERMRLARGKDNWYFPKDVLMIWDVSAVPPVSPDISAIPDVEALDKEGKDSFGIGRDGPVPAAVIEVTSKSTRHIDFGIKPDTYAAAGVSEYLIVDIRNPVSEPWQLHGYRLDKSPYYQTITPDEEGGIILQSLDIRFVPIARTRIDLFDATTGERLRSAEEFEELAEAEAARADAADATIETLMARIRELEANQ